MNKFINRFLLVSLFILQMFSTKNLSTSPHCIIYLGVILLIAAVMCDAQNINNKDLTFPRHTRTHFCGRLLTDTLSVLCSPDGFNEMQKKSCK